MWPITLLTPEYVVDAMLDADWSTWVLSAGPKTVAGLRPMIVWGARLQAAGQLALPSPLASPQIVVNDSECVAAIPRDPNGMDFVTKNTRCQAQVPAQILAGSYAVRGVVISPESADRGLAFIAGYQSFVVQGAAPRPGGSAGRRG